MLYQIIVYETTVERSAVQRAAQWNARKHRTDSGVFQAGFNPATGKYTVWKVVAQKSKGGR